MLINIEEKDDSIQKARQALAHIPDGAEKAIANAANRAIQSARTAGNRSMRKIYVGLRAGDINGRIRIKRAAPGNLTAKMTAKGRTIKLLNFKNRISKKGVFAQVKVGGGGVIKQSFYGTVNSGLGIFVRISKKRYPIKMTHGPSMPQMLGNPKVADDINTRGAEVFETRLAHEVERMLSK